MANDTTKGTATKSAPMKVETKVEATETKKPKKTPLQSLYPTAEAAVEEAKKRTKGPRRAFKCSHGGKDYFCVANNEGRAGGVAFMQIGGQVEELGRAPRAAKALGVEGVLAAVNALPAEQRDAVMAQLKALAGGK